MQNNLVNRPAVPVLRAGACGVWPQGAAFVGGRYMPMEEASVPIGDWGFLHSDATYDVAHVWEGAFFRLEDHLDRFHAGMSALHMTLPFTRDEMRAVVVECVRLSGLRNAYVEMICTRGMPAPGSRDPRSAINRFYAFAVPFIWLADPEKQKVGLHLAIGKTVRIPTTSVDPRIKNYHWLDLVKGLYEAYDQGAETTVLTDGEGHVVEGPGFNLFVLRGGALLTPDTGVLEGITRRTVLEIAAALDIPTEVRPVRTEELRDADEVFATSTAGGVVPICRLEGRPVASGVPGTTTRQIHEQYWRWHELPQLRTAVDYT
jgi:branched-chain amino acid aminotransferase